MARNLTESLKTAIHARETGVVLVHLLKLTHPSLSDPIRVCDDAVDIVSGGYTYTAFPFELTMAADDEDAPPTAKLRICGVDGTITRAARGLSGPAMGVTLSLVMLASPDIVEIGPIEFSLRDVSYEAGIVEGTLRYDDWLNEPYPADSVTPSNFPALATVI